MEFSSSVSRIFVTSSVSEDIINFAFLVVTYKVTFLAKKTSIGLLILSSLIII